MPYHSTTWVNTKIGNQKYAYERPYVYTGNDGRGKKEIQDAIKTRSLTKCCKTPSMALVFS